MRQPCQNAKVALSGGNKGGLGVVVDEWSTLSRLVGLRGFKREKERERESPTNLMD